MSVHSLCRTNRNIKVEEDDRFYLSELLKDFYIIKLDNNNEIACSFDHKFNTNKGYISTNYLEIGDIINNNPIRKIVDINIIHSNFFIEFYKGDNKNLKI